jgi:hypothetical protein
MTRRLSVSLTRKEADVLLSAVVSYETELEDRARDGESVGREIQAVNRAAGKLARALRLRRPA